MLSVDERVKYYTNNLEEIIINFDVSKQHAFWYDNSNNKHIYEEQGRAFHKMWLVNKNFNENYFINNSEGNPIIQYDVNAYVKPMIKKFKSDVYFKDKTFLTRFGDVFFSIPIPVITKTRPSIIKYKNSKNTKNVLINLDRNRHWNLPISKVKRYDIPFKNKNNKIIWRGGFTGFGWDPNNPTLRPNRKTLCENYHDCSNPLIDIGPVGSNPYPSIFTYSGKIKNYIDISIQLKSKFIISVEGGDVATNLKWILYSNSIPLMAQPTMCSWLMEENLKPWVHYVPLNDQFDDLEEKYNWCLKNLDKCEEIAKNGKKYIEQFLDENREKKITNLVLRNYADKVKIFYK